MLLLLLFDTWEWARAFRYCLLLLLRVIIVIVIDV